MVATPSILARGGGSLLKKYKVCKYKIWLTSGLSFSQENQVGALSNCTDTSVF